MCIVAIRLPNPMSMSGLPSQAKRWHAPLRDLFSTRQHCALDTEGDDREKERHHTDENTQLDPGGNVDLVWSKLLTRATAWHTGRQPEEWLELGGEQDVDPLRQHADDE